MMRSALVLLSSSVVLLTYTFCNSIYLFSLNSFINNKESIDLSAPFGGQGAVISSPLIPVCCSSPAQWLINIQSYSIL